MTDFIRVLRRTIVGALIVGVFVVVGLMTPKVHAATGVNQQMNFQGRLLNAQGATVPDGYYNIQFKIYQDGTGTVAGNPSGTLKWTESWLNTAGHGVQVRNGYLSVQLGSITSLSSVDWNQDTLWLSINIGNTNTSCTPFTSCGGDGEMLPMKRLSSTPYSLNSGMLGGLTSAQFLQLAQGVQTEAGNNTASVAINKTGANGSFINLQSNSVDVFTVANTGDISFGNNIDHTIGVTTAAASTAGKSLTISAGTAGTGAGPLTGGTLVLQGGNGGGTGGNGGNVTLDAGAAASGGVGGTVNIGTTNASAIILGQNTTLSAGKSLTLTGGSTASRPASPVEGMLYFDSDTKQLLTYSNGKWQADRSSATKIVAASNSTAAQKASADYVATGTSDQSTINAALTAAAGGKVYLMEGTYTTDDTISIPNNTTLSGAGRNTLIQFANINGQTKNMITNTDTTTGEGIVIRDLRLDGLKATNTTGTMHGVYFNGMGGSSGSTARNGATITNTWVLNFLSYGVYLNSSANGTITNNTIQANSGNGLYLSSSNRVNVSNNTVQGNGGSGIWLAGSLFDAISSNNVVGNSNSGIGLNGNSANNTISTNNLYNNTGSGTASSISLASVNNNQISGNSINDTAGTGSAISIDSASANNYLSDNTFNGTGATSISDASATSVYANQSRAASGGQLTNRSANDSQAFTVQNATGSNILAVDTSASQVILGNASTAGKLAINDGAGHTGTIQMATASGNYTYTLPALTANDTFCMVTLNNCAADSTKFIQNQNSAAQTTATYWIDGTGRADTSILTPKLDTATGTALTIGTTTATGITIGKSSTTTTVNGNLGVTLNTTAGTTITCQNTSGYLSVCDSSVLTPSAANFIQNGTTLQTGANFWIDGYGKIAGGVQTGNIDTIGTSGSLSIGTGNAGSLTIGKTGVTTTIQGNIGVTLNATTGTTQVCRNATGLLSSCDATFLAPTATNFIQNQTTAQTGNFNISGTGIAGTLQAANIVGTTFDTATGVALNIGAAGAPTATVINLNQNVTVAAGKSLTITGSGTRPASPTEGMLYYDTTTHQLIQWNGSKWVSDRSTSTKIVAASNSSQAIKDSADYVADGTADEVEINAALTAAAGGKVYLSEGTYAISANVSIPANTTLAGAGAGTIITLPTGLNGSFDAVTASGTRVAIRDLTLDGNKANQSSGSMNGFSSSQTFSSVSDVAAKNWTNSGIITSGNYSSVTNSIAQSNANIGIASNGATGVNISGNNVIANADGIYISSVSDSTITSNTVRSNTDTAIYSMNSSTTVLTGNTAYGGNYGIYMYGSSGNTVSNNMLEQNAVFGILMDYSSSNNTVTSNTISGSGGAAISVNHSSASNYLASNTLGGSSISDAGTGTIYGGQLNASGNYVVQPAGTVELQKNTNVTGALSASTSVLSPNIDRATAGTLTIGTNSTNTTALTIGSSGVTTTIQGNTGVTLNATTGTTMVCRNASGVLAICDAGYLAPTATNFIQNGTSQQASSNFNISGTGQAITFQAATSVLTPLLDAATSSTALNIGTNNASVINLNQNVALASTKTLSIAGDTRSNINGIASPTEGMMTYDTTNKQLLVYANGKWQADRSSAILVAASNSSDADKAAADYVATGTADQTPINSALTAADPSGSGRKTGKVYLFAGTYTVNGSINVPNNTTLAGTGTGTVITIPNSTNANFTAITNSTTGGNGTGVIIQDLKLDGNKANQTAGPYAMYAIQFNGMGSATLPGGKILNVSANNWYGNGASVWTAAGIYINAGSRNTIANIVAQDNTTSGIIFNTSTYNSLTGSDFRGNTYGIYVAANNNTITGNTPSGNSSNGIYVNGNQNTITGNVATGNTNTNIYLYAASSNTVSSNQALGSISADGIGLTSTSTYNIISSNTVQSNSTGGIYLGSPATNNTVTGNKIHNNGGNNNKGIYLVGASSNTLTNNTITDTANSASNNPINIDASSNNTYLSNNTFSSTAANGTIADAGTGTVYVSQSKSEGGGQITNRTANDTQAFTVQNASGTNVLDVDTTGSGKVLVSGALDTTTSTTLTIGAATASAITIGSGTITTTIAGNTGVTLNGTTGTTMVCRNTTGLLSACDATYLTPTATNFIQNQNAAAQTTANFWISGTGQAATLTASTVNATTNLVTPSIDTASVVALTLGGTTASSVDIGKAAGTINLKANSTLVGTAAATGTITIQGAAQTVAATAGNEFKLKGSTGYTTGTGGQLTLQGGDGGATSGTNGGNVYIAGGNGSGTGVSGLVVMTTPTFSTAIADANCFTSGATVANSCTISSASVNGTGAVLVGFSASGKTATLPDPTISTAGRVIYVTASGGSEDFTLSVNGGGQGNQIAMRKNTTATMIWNGADWTAAGASSSTTLQAAYDNTLQSSGGAELVVSKTSATNGLTIRDSSTSSVNGALLNVQSSSAANLFSVNSNVTEYATNSGAETGGNGGGLGDNTFPSSTWATIASPASTVTRYTTAGDNIATGQGSVSVVTPATINAGVMDRLSTSLTANMTYNVSFSARLAAGSAAFTDMTVYYSINGTAQSVLCASNQTAKTSIWTKINCTFQAPSSGITATNSILIQQATGVARTLYIDNLSVTIAANYNYATDPGVDNTASFTTNWSAAGTATVSQNLSDGYDASSSAQVSTSTASSGVRNLLSINPLQSTLYRVSVYTKLNSGAALTDFTVRYTPNGGTNFIPCVDYSTQIVTSSWAQITCYIKTDTTTLGTPYIYFTQATASGTRVFSVDTFSMTLASNSTPNVQIGSGSNGGPTTLFTVDKGASAPIAANNDALLGSMYYDTTLGKLQCYEADGWGACGSSPDNIITISPEYTNAVMHGTGVGTMTSDFCSSASGININDGTSGQPTICNSGETYNFYKWTSPQATSQAYSIYVTYQLPTTFKTFSSGLTSLQARVDNTSNASVQLQIYKNHSGLTACGSNVTITTSTNTWQSPVAFGTADPSTCGFVGGDSIVFKITLSSKSNANAYIGNLNFTFSNK